MQSNRNMTGAADPKTIGALVVVVAVLAVAGYLLFGGGGGAEVQRMTSEAQIYYVNLDSGAMVAAPRGLGLPPVELPGGGKGVRAHVFGCGSCNSPFVGYVEQVTDEYKARGAEIEQAERDAPPQIFETQYGELARMGKQIALWPEDAGANPSLEWVSKRDMEEDIKATVAERCSGGQQIRVCTP